MKALHDDCPKFEFFPPGHLYSSAGGGFRRWYNPEWFAELFPETPFQPLVLREAFEKVHTLTGISRDNCFVYAFKKV